MLEQNFGYTASKKKKIREARSCHYNTCLITKTGAIMFISTEETQEGVACYPTDSTQVRWAPFHFLRLFSAITCVGAHRKKIQDKPREFESTLLRNFLCHPASGSTWIFVSTLFIRFFNPTYADSLSITNQETADTSPRPISPHLPLTPSMKFGIHCYKSNTLWIQETTALTKIIITS